MGEAAAGVLLCTKRTKVSHFEAGMLSRVGLDAGQTDAIPSQMIRTQCTHHLHGIGALRQKIGKADAVDGRIAYLSRGRIPLSLMLAMIEPSGC